MNGQRGWLRPCTRVYLVMMALTFATFVVGATGVGGLGASLSVLTLALVKGQLVGDYFMGLKGLQSIWRWVISLWLFLTGSLIAAAFVLSRLN